LAEAAKTQATCSAEWARTSCTPLSTTARRTTLEPILGKSAIPTAYVEEEEEVEEEDDG
jgi:hypothetical protein